MSGNCDFYLNGIGSSSSYGTASPIKVILQHGENISLLYYSAPNLNCSSVTSTKRWYSVSGVPAFSLLGTSLSSSGMFSLSIHSSENVSKSPVRLDRLFL